MPGLAHGGSYPRPSYEVYSHSGLNFLSRSGLVVRGWWNGGVGFEGQEEVGVVEMVGKRWRRRGQTKQPAARERERERGRRD